MQVTAVPRSTLVDLSHTVEHGLETYRGLPGPIICDFLSREASRARYAPGTEFHIGRIDMGDAEVVPEDLDAAGGRGGG